MEDADATRKYIGERRPDVVASKLLSALDELCAARLACAYQLKHAGTREIATRPAHHSSTRRIPIDDHGP